MSKVVVIGGGAAGMFAAIFAARNGNQVAIYEKNEKLGKKLYITGKGRCNITNASDIEDVFSAIISNSKFMYSSLYGFTNYDVIQFFEELGVATKIERGNRVFPVSDHSSDVIGALTRELHRLDVDIHYHSIVKRVRTMDGRFVGIELTDGTKISADACIVATGGISYETTGSTGDGYRFAEHMGHTITDTYPSLVPMAIKEWYAKELQGLSLRNVTATILDGKKKLYTDMGEMLFTHYGVTGPLILSGSSYIGKKLKNKDGSSKELKLIIDLKPALSVEQLDHRILRDFEDNTNKQFKNSIGKLFPSKLIPIMIELSGIDPDKKVNVINKEERLRFVHLIKNFEMTITGLRDYNEAIITKGGVKTSEIDPGTMESKLVSGVYYVGEVLDLDALTGGYNLQIAWSTAYAAGNSI